MRSPYCYLLLTIFILNSCGQTGKEHHKNRAKAALKGLSHEGHFQILQEDLCPVCGMKVKNHEKFACAVQLNNGKTFYTCGTGCLIRIWLNPEPYLGEERSALSKMMVQEFFSGQVMDANKVVFIAGSDFIGPMGKAVAPLTPDLIETYKKRHGGQETFLLRSITVEDWERITKSE